MNIDENGRKSVEVGIPMAAFALVVTVLLAMIPAVMAYGALTEKVDNLQQENVARIATLDAVGSNVGELNEIAASTSVSLVEIQKDIEEIKTDVRQIKNELHAQP